MNSSMQIDGKIGPNDYTSTHDFAVDINPIPTTKKSYVKDLPWVESAHV